MTHPILSQFEAAELPPAAALRAAVAQAEDLAAPVAAMAAKLCAGIYLMPPQRRVLLYGLPCLAAARHPAVSGIVADLMRLPEEDLDVLWPDCAGAVLARLHLTIWDGNADRLFQTIEHADLCPSSLYGLFALLTQVTKAGAIPMERTATFLERFERDAIAGDTDPAWLLWLETVAALGLSALEPAARHVLAKDIGDFLDEEHRERILGQIRGEPQASQGQNAQQLRGLLGEPGTLRPIDDPVEALEWVGAQAAGIETAWAELKAEMETEAGMAPGTWEAAVAMATAEVGLTPGELTWLSGFLTSRQAPQTTMPFEMLDGFITALAIGPKPPTIDAILPVIWGREEEAENDEAPANEDASDADAAGAEPEGPEWDGPTQRDFVIGLIGKHLEQRSRQHREGESFVPFLQHPEDDEEAGGDWAAGFLEAVKLHEPAWEPLLRTRRAAELIAGLMLLASDDPDSEETIDAEARSEMVEDLPAVVDELSRLWRQRQSTGGNGVAGMTRTAKVGRNDPCPCGSGKKHKKCCGT